MRKLRTSSNILIMKRGKRKITAKQFDKIFDEGKEDILPYRDLKSARWVSPRSLAMLEKSAGNLKKGKAAKAIPSLRKMKQIEAIKGFPGISWRDAIGGHEAYVQGHRVAVWEVQDVYHKVKSIGKTAKHFRWPPALVQSALAYAKAFPDDIAKQREAESF